MYFDISLKFWFIWLEGTNLSSQAKNDPNKFAAKKVVGVEKISLESRK